MQYEDITIRQGPNPLEASTTDLYDAYRQLTYDGFRAYRVALYPMIDTKPNGKQAMIGYNESRIYTAGPNSIQPKSASLGCVGYLANTIGLWVECTVHVTAFYDIEKEKEYPTSVDCRYRGYGNLTQCDFPAEWNETIGLKFEIRDANPTILSDDNLGRKNVSLDDYYIRFLLDDFSATYQCDNGLDAETGLCEYGYSSHENELRK
jgi:hypothetical protein